MSETITPVIGIIGGSGLYNIEGLTDTRWERVETPWGAPSDELLVGEFGGVKVVFLPRHGPTNSTGFCSRPRRSKMAW